MKVDYFKDITSEQNIHQVEIEIEEKIHDEIPVYYSRRSGRRSFLDTDNDADFDSYVNNTMKEMILKQKFNDIGMFCFVSWDWVIPFAEWIGDKRCLEVMAGRGWLTKGLRERDVNIIATDDFSWHRNYYTKWNDLVTEVEELDAVESVEKYGKDIDILIMTWAYMDNTAYEVIKKLYEVNPEAKVVFCGEGQGGCTANDNFFEHFNLIEDDAFYAMASNYRTWFSVHDRLTLGKYEPMVEGETNDEETL